MLSKGWKWVLGLVYIIIVAAIWIAASFVVQSVVDSGVSPFLITYICNSLFVVYIPIVEIARYVEDSVGNLWFKFGKESDPKQLGDATKTALLNDGNSSTREECLNPVEFGEQTRMVHHRQDIELETETGLYESELLAGEEDSSTPVGEAEVLVAGGKGLDAKGRWTRTRVAKIGLLISPFWFLAQLTFNFSLKYTTVTANTILSSVSSLFTFLVSLAFLGEKFTWVKLFSVLLCMAGTVIVTLGDSGEESNAIAYKPLLGDILALVSAGLYAVYITLIRQKIPDEDKGEGKASMAQFLGFLGLGNLLIFLPVALVLNFTKLEPFHRLSWTQVGLIVGKGLLDNVLSDYLWAKAVLLTTTTVATAGLTIQVPMAAVVDSITGHAPNIMDYLGGAAIMLGFVGINLPENVCCRLWGGQGEHEAEADLVPSLADKSTTVS